MKFSKPVLFLAIAGLAATLNAQSSQGRAEVRAIRGHATYSTANASGLPLTVDTVLLPGMTVATGDDSGVDLFLGRSAGTLRLTENTALGLSAMKISETAAGTVVNVQLDLPRGSILGDARNLPKASKYEVKMPNGVAGIRGAQFKCAASSFLLLLEGELVYVHVSPDGQPAPHILQGPPAVYFSPFDGVKAAPLDVVRMFVVESTTRLDRLGLFSPDRRDVRRRLGAGPGTFTRR